LPLHPPSLPPWLAWSAPASLYPFCQNNRFPFNTEQLGLVTKFRVPCSKMRQNGTQNPFWQWLQTGEASFSQTAQSQGIEFTNYSFNTRINVIGLYRDFVTFANYCLICCFNIWLGLQKKIRIAPAQDSCASQGKYRKNMTIMSYRQDCTRNLISCNMEQLLNPVPHRIVEWKIREFFLLLFPILSP
jgi:hypothetical protein